MGKLREIREKGYIIPWKMLKITMGALPALLKAMVKHPVLIMKSNMQARKIEEQLKHELPYEIPEYKPGMPYYKENKRYLRPTHLCNSHAPEIIALANELGAFELEPYEYANNVFNFVKRNIKLAFVGLDREVDTLRRGSGTCIHQLSLMIALLRAGGVPARYRLYSLAVVKSLYENEVAASEVVKEWYDAMGAFMLHGTGEVYIDGEWITADPTFTPEYEAAMGIPLAKLGEDPTGIWNLPVKGTEMVLEGLPYGVGVAWNLLTNWIARGERLKVDISMEKARERGRKILQEMGEEAYDEMVRKKYKAEIPKITLEKAPQIVFVD